jgi:hypothetical protein
MAGHAVEMRLRSCRIISRFLYPCGRQSFIWAGYRYPALAAYPEVHRDGPSLLPYLALLRVGFALPAKLLPPRCALTAPFHPYLRQYRSAFAGGIFSVALSVSVTGPRPLAGTPPCGDRTFLHRFATAAIVHPAASGFIVPLFSPGLYRPTRRHID